MENPITVSTAAMKCWSSSSGKGTTEYRKENTASVTNTSCNSAMIVPNEYLQSRNRIKMYKKIMMMEKITALKAPASKEAEIVGVTFLFPCTNLLVANSCAVVPCGRNSVNPLYSLLNTTESTPGVSWLTR